MTAAELANGGAAPGGFDVEAVHELATRARRAFEQGGFELVTLQAFPTGACGDVSEMLGQLLADRGLGKWQYTSHRALPSHAWLERDGWIVDITGDQFNDLSQYRPEQPDVTVTRDRGWHDSHFPSPKGSRSADMSWFDGNHFETQARRDFAVLEQRTRS